MGGERKKSATHWQSVRGRDAAIIELIRHLLNSFPNHMLPNHQTSGAPRRVLERQSPTLPISPKSCAGNELPQSPTQTSCVLWQPGGELHRALHPLTSATKIYRPGPWTPPASRRAGTPPRARISTQTSEPGLIP